MEEDLIRMAAILLNISEVKSGLVLYSIANFHVWLNFIDELFSLEPKYATQQVAWIAENSSLKGLNDIRVRLAHHASRFMDPDADTRPALKPSLLDPRLKSRKHSPLTSGEILIFTTKVVEQSRRLEAIWKAMQHIASLDTKPPPEADPPAAGAR
jgi:hypothetical protein